VIDHQVPGETSSATGDGDAVVPWQAERGVQEFVHLLAETAVAAVHRRGADAVLVERHAADVADSPAR
jgi:hypothetical protein